MATICCKGHCFENIQAVLFDKDGTLANVEDYLIGLARARSHQVAAQVAAQVGAQTQAHASSTHDTDLENTLLQLFGVRQGPRDSELDPAGLMAVGSRADNKVALAAQLATKGYGWIESLALVEQAFGQAQLSLPEKVGRTPPIEGAIPFLHQLHQVGVTLAIVSSDTHPNVAAFARHYQLSNIRWLCGAAAGMLPKTHPDFLRFACESVGVDPANTLVVGDSAADLALACQGAAGFLGMTGGWRCWQRLAKDAPPVIALSRPPLAPTFDSETAVSAASIDDVLSGDVLPGDVLSVMFDRFSLVESFI